MILFNGIITKIETMADGAPRLKIDFNGECTPEMMGDFYAMRLKAVSIGMKSHDDESSDLSEEKLSDAPEPPKSDKSPSKRLRDVLFRLWQHEGGESTIDWWGDFEGYYEAKIDALIDHYKNKLP